MYFQNPFCVDFLGTWVLADRKRLETYKCPANTGAGTSTLNVWGTPPYNLNGNDGDGNNLKNLTLNWSFDNINYSSYSIDLTAGAASASAVQPTEIVTAINADTTLNALFTASLTQFVSGGPTQTPSRVLITFKRPMRVYVSNSGAETQLKFNARAGVAQLPDYFLRHTVANMNNFSDGVGLLIPLSHIISANSAANPSVVTSVDALPFATGSTIYITGSNSTSTINGTRVATTISGTTFSVPVNVSTGGDRGRYSTTVEANVINNAVNNKGVSLGYSATSVKDDWTLLNGDSGLFTFAKNTVDTNSRITQSIQYPAGAKVGDLAMKIKNTYTGSQTQPDVSVQIPYVLTAGDLVTVP